MTFGLFLDLLIAVLLIVTISYAVVLNRRLSMMRRDKAALERLASSFTQATGRAEESIGKLKQTAESLRERMDKAQSLRDDLVFLVERGTGTADRLEELVRETRGVGQGYAGESPDRAPLTQRPGPVAVVSSGRTVAAAKAPSPQPPPQPPPQPQPKQSVRSEAERQLLRAIRAAS